MDQSKYIETLIAKLERAVIDGFDKVEKKLDNKASHTDIQRIETYITELKNTKLDKDEFEPFKNILSKVNWLVISAVLWAIIYIVIQS